MSPPTPPVAPKADCKAAFDEKKPNYPGREADKKICTQQALKEAEQAVASYCFLPDPRPQGFWPSVARTITSITKPLNHLSVKDCVKRHIDAKFEWYHVTPPKPGDSEYMKIIKNAGVAAINGAKLCQVREFEDLRDEPLPYKGYRGADKKCHAIRVTTSK